MTKTMDRVALLGKLCSREVLMEAGERSTVTEGPVLLAIKEELLFGIPSFEPALRRALSRFWHGLGKGFLFSCTLSAIMCRKQPSCFQFLVSRSYSGKGRLPHRKKCSAMRLSLWLLFPQSPRPDKVLKGREAHVKDFGDVRSCDPLVQILPDLFFFPIKLALPDSSLGSSQKLALSPRYSFISLQ